ncbi:hypothetical protein HK405_004702 [Cladochytrium tenue]|nr:hypothetical protein HK405_004702 [Cladochytrium tenue]
MARIGRCLEGCRIPDEFMGDGDGIACLYKYNILKRSLVASNEEQDFLSDFLSACFENDEGLGDLVATFKELCLGRGSGQSTITSATVLGDSVREAAKLLSEAVSSLDPAQFTDIPAPAPFRGRGRDTRVPVPPQRVPDLSAGAVRLPLDVVIFFQCFHLAFVGGWMRRLARWQQLYGLEACRELPFATLWTPGFMGPPETWSLLHAAPAFSVDTHRCPAFWLAAHDPAAEPPTLGGSGPRLLVKVVELVRDNDGGGSDEGAVDAFVDCTPGGAGASPTYGMVFAKRLQARLQEEPRLCAASLTEFLEKLGRMTDGDGRDASTFLDSLWAKVLSGETAAL